MTDASFLAEEILREAGEWDPGEDAIEVAAVSYVRHLEVRRAALYARDGGEAMPDIDPGYEWNRELADE